MGGGSTEKEAIQFKNSGFRTEADVMAVPHSISRLANLHRYQTGREQDGHGRIVATPVHDKAYIGIPNTLEGAHDRVIQYSYLHFVFANMIVSALNDELTARLDQGK